MICTECQHPQTSHMVNGYGNAVCQVGGLTEDPCQCKVPFIPTRIWNETKRRYDCQCPRFGMRHRPDQCLSSNPSDG